MSGLDLARQSLGEGRFSDAIRQLNGLHASASPEYHLLLAEARWRLGHLDQATVALGFVDESVEPVFRCKWLEVTANILRERGHTSDSVAAFREGVAVAESARNLKLLCRLQLGLFNVVLEQRGPEASAAMATEIRQNVIRAGDADLVGSLHARFAELEARRGDFARAFRHLDAGLRIAESRPNFWLLGTIWHIRAGTEALMGSIDDALRSARRARDAAKQSGHERVRLSALGNLGFMSLWAGQPAQAEAAFKEIGAGAPRGGSLWFSVQDSRALRALCVGELDQCDHFIREGQTQINHLGLPLHSWQALELRLLDARRKSVVGDLAGACETLEQGVGLVSRRGDSHLRAEYALEISHISRRCGRAGRSALALDEFVAAIQPGDIGRRADMHWLKAQHAFAAGELSKARQEYRRASRIWTELGGRHPWRSSPPALVEAEEPLAASVRSEPATIATLLSLGTRPRLLGAEAAELLMQSGCASRVRVASGPPGSRRIVFDNQSDGAEPAKAPSHCVELGDQKGSPFQLQVYASQSAGSVGEVVTLLGLVEAGVRLARLQREERHRTSLWPAEEGLMQEGNVFVAPRMREIRTLAHRVGPSDLPVLITGETGAGKEIVAREVHDSSPRAGKSFGVVVCSGVPREMLDSHLFGHRRGAFTGAIDNFIGVIRANEGGTLFLDEIGEVSPDLQVKLLRFLETGEVHPLGETKPVKVNVRIIAATNQPLEALMSAGRFREDLFYRLNVVRVTIPPLRERREEILPLFERFLIRECARLGRAVPSLSDDAIEHLLLYKWPGNVRQVLNEVKRIMAVLPSDEDITVSALAGEITSERQAAIERAVAATPNQMLVRTDQPLAAAIEQVERAMLTDALATSPDLETAAGKLDITRKGLFLKRQRLGLDTTAN